MWFVFFFFFKNWILGHTHWYSVYCAQYMHAGETICGTMDRTRVRYMQVKCLNPYTISPFWVLFFSLESNVTTCCFHKQNVFVLSILLFILLGGGSNPVVLGSYWCFSGTLVVPIWNLGLQHKLQLFEKEYRHWDVSRPLEAETLSSRSTIFLSLRLWPRIFFFMFTDYFLEIFVLLSKIKQIKPSSIIKPIWIHLFSTQIEF